MNRSRPQHKVLPLFLFVIAIFVFFLGYILISFHLETAKIEDTLHQTQIESEKMQISSELMELARSRTRLTSRIIDLDDVFEQDELNVQLENHAGRFAQLRGELLEFPLSQQERQILEQNDSIVPIILPAQRQAVELAMNDTPEERKQAENIFYSTVMPGQNQMIEGLGELVGLGRERIAELTLLRLQAVRDYRTQQLRVIGSVLTVLLV